MPQLQEGDEIVHINGRIVKELPHQEVMYFLWFIPSLWSPGSKYKFSLLSTIHFFNGTSETSETKLFTDFLFFNTRDGRRERECEARRGEGKQIEPIEE